jgi:hypothetical protein
MKQFIAVFNSDLPNRYNIVFPVSTLVSCLEQKWRFGAPSLINHDSNRICGWSKPTGIHIQPGCSRLFGSISFAENEKDKEEIENNYIADQQQEILSHASSFEQLIKSLHGHLNGREYRILTECVSLGSPGLARRIFKDIFSKEDDDGLVPLSILTPIGPGVFRVGKHALFAHSYFRRGLSHHNTLNSPFLTCLFASCSENDLKVRIKMDPDLIGLAETFKTPMEMAYWWGPKFNDDLSIIKVGVTRHESTGDENIFYGLSRTEFRWYEQGGFKTFESEEVLDRPSLGVGKTKYGARFIHSKLDKNSVPVHLDGAIRMYDEEKMIGRLGLTLETAPRDTVYTKLWRIDGNILVPKWKELLTHYYRDNTHMGEYLDNNCKNDFKPVASAPTLNNQPLSKYIPVNFENENGPRIAVSYHSKIDMGNLKLSRFVQSKNFYGLGEIEYHYIEPEIIEINKILSREKEDLEIDSKFAIIAFEGNNINLHLIAHVGMNSVTLANKTLDSIKQYTKALISNNYNRAITFSLSIEYEDRSVCYSFAGHIINIYELIETGLCSFPKHTEKIPEWCTGIKEYISGKYGQYKDTPSLVDYLKPSGEMHIDKKILQPGECEFYQEDNKIMYRVNLAEDTEGFEAISKGKLTVAPIWILEDLKCLKCNKNYMDCECIRFVDSGVTLTPANAEPIGCFWTQFSKNT